MSTTTDISALMASLEGLDEIDQTIIMRNAVKEDRSILQNDRVLDWVRKTTKILLINCSKDENKSFIGQIEERINAKL